MPERSLSTKCPAGFWDQEGDKEMPRAGSQRLTLGNVTADEGDGGGGASQLSPREGRATPGHRRCPGPCPTLAPSRGSETLSCEEMRFVERTGEVIRTGTPLAARSLRGSPGRIPPSTQSHTSVKVRHNCETSAPVSSQHPAHLRCLLLPECLGAIAGAQQNKCAHYCGDSQTPRPSTISAPFDR